MTVVNCDCGGTVNTEVSPYCTGCRCALNEQRVKVDPFWCWEWFGPSFHRMKCRRRIGHEGEHHDHSDDDVFCIANFKGKKFDYERRDDGLLYVRQQ